MFRGLLSQSGTGGRILLQPDADKGAWIVMRLFSSRKAQLEQKARELEEREARLIQREQALEQQSVQSEEGASPPPSGPRNAKERFYDKIPVTVHQLDIFIGICIAAFVLVVLIGAIQGQG